jgi:hypothetical protein
MLMTQREEKSCLGNKSILKSDYFTKMDAPPDKNWHLSDVLPVFVL